MAAPPEKRARTDPVADTFSVVFPGEEGSLTHIATTRFFANSPKAELKGVETFAEAFNAVKAGSALYAIVPIENSTSGCIEQTYDLMAEHSFVIGGELGVQENYCICGKEGTELLGIRRVLSHPNIIDACSAFIEKKMAVGAETVATKSTTEAARRVAGDAEKAGTVAAIATREAAVRNGLKILASNIGNYTQTETRYILIHRNTGPVAQTVSPFPRDAVSPVRKHSAVFAVSDEPGALYRLLSCWALRGINVLKLETRPLKVAHKAPRDLPVGQLWDFLVFIEYAVPPGQTEEGNQKLWANLEEFSVWRRDMGIYPSQTSRAMKKQPQCWDDMIDIMCKA